MGADNSQDEGAVHISHDRDEDKLPLRKRIGKAAFAITLIIGIVSIVIGSYIAVYYTMSQYSYFEEYGQRDFSVTDFAIFYVVGFALAVTGIVLVGRVLFSGYDPDKIARTEMIEADQRRSGEQPLVDEPRISRDIATQTCRYCGSTNPIDAAFCGSCEKPIILKEEIIGKKKVIAEIQKKMELREYASRTFLQLIILMCIVFSALFVVIDSYEYAIDFRFWLIWQALCYVALMYSFTWSFFMRPPLRWSVGAILGSIILLFVLYKYFHEVNFY